MSTRIVCVDPNAHQHNPRELDATGQSAAYGEEIEIEDSDLAESLLEQETVWARPTSNAAKDAIKEAKHRPVPFTDTASKTTAVDAADTEGESE